MKTSLSKEIIACLCSQGLQGLHGLDTLSFAIECLRENKKVRKTVIVCSYGAQVEFFKQNNGQNSLNTVPFSLFH